jgi:hypothetical protein
MFEMPFGGEDHSNNFIVFFMFTLFNSFFEAMKK